MITSKEMRALEVNAEYFGLSRLQLMENAGQTVAAEVAARYKAAEAQVAVFCGLGGNGGDGLVAARHLTSSGFNVQVIIAGRSRDVHDVEARRNWIALQAENTHIQVHEVYDTTLIPSVEADVVVDALLGIGLKDELRPPILPLVQTINEMNAFRLAIDVPTGVDADSGKVLGEAVRADVTVTFHRKKPGLEKAKQYTGKVIVRNIGIPREFERWAGPGDVDMITKPRSPDAHKGDFGRLLVIGGSEVFSGAPALVALAALRTGVDLTYIAAPHKIAQVISSFSPNLITVKLTGEHLNPLNIPVIERYLKLASAVVMGPGLGLHKETKETVLAIIKRINAAKMPLLLDADGLKAFAQEKPKTTSPLVLTPHAGEFQELTAKKIARNLEKTIVEVQKTARKHESTILLKGKVDVISDGARSKINFTGNPGMTVGGTGDVLAGIVGALLAQGAAPFEAAAAGAFINGAAGDFVRKEIGHHMTAMDLLAWIPRVMEDPMAHRKMNQRAS